MRLRRLIVILLLPVIIWAISKFIVKPLILMPNERTIKSHFASKKIALLIAHPDDEAMFFGPTMHIIRRLALITNTPTTNIPDTNFRILCLSTGNAENLGETRRNELIASAAKFGIPPTNVVVFDDPAVQDAMGTTWHITDIDRLVTKFLADVDVVITFDGSGVSGHTNHISLYNYAHNLIAPLGSKEVWVLKSTSIFRKYTSFFDIPFSYIYNRLFSPSGSTVVMVSDAKEYSQTRDAMTKAHVSQMIWFRWGWISLSRYMVVNELARVI
ncbi:putative deacetylase LmbE-like domain-containing protein [Dipodascopsis uninucleata]